MYDCVVIGGGQAGLATGYYLRRAGLNFLIVDEQPSPGGAWRHVWPSLTLFSAHTFSNLPGMPMPPYPGYPPASHVVDYFARYEKRYNLPILRPVHVENLSYFPAKSYVMATGHVPFIPTYPGQFSGKQWHSSTYPGSEPFRDQRVAVVGAGNSAAQIVADLILGAEAPQWFTRHPPRYLPDDVDGAALFRAFRTGTSLDGDIVMMPSIKRAWDRMEAQPMFDSLDEVAADHLIWCTGFRPAYKGQGFQVGTRGKGAATIQGVAPFAKEVVDQVRREINI